MVPFHKKIVLTVLAVIFIGVGSYLILMALGWLPDFNHMRLVRTGGLYVNFSPLGATLYVNEKPYELKSLIGGGLLVNGLFPGEYRLRLSQEGYADWKKNLKVESGKVTVANNVRLWPRNFYFEMVASSTKDFWVTKAGIVKFTKDKKLFLAGSILKGNSVELSSPDSNLIVSKNNATRFLINLESPLGAINLDEIFRSLKRRQLETTDVSPIEETAYHPFNPQKIIIKTRSFLYVLDTKKIELEKLVTAESIQAITLNGNEAFIVDAKGSLVSVNLLINSTSTLPLKLPSVEKIKALGGGNKFVILSKSGDLLLYERRGKLELLFKNAKGFSLSPDEKRLLATDNSGKVSMVYLSDYETNDKITVSFRTIVELPLPAFQKEVEIPTWLSNEPNYLLTKIADGLYLTELDKRPPVNSYLISTSTAKYSVAGDKLTILKANGDLSTRNGFF